MEPADGATTTRPSATSTDRSASETFPPTLHAPRHVRNFVASTMRSWGYDDLCDTTELLVSEIVTNVVVHARTPGRVTVAERPSGVRVSVTDTGRDLPDPRDPSPAEPDGRGLGIVGVLSQRWGVEVDVETKTVWFELDGSTRDVNRRRGGRPGG
jgi:anti-sigma regulatory factor (Ser/Thr protein kinase)